MATFDDTTLIECGLGSLDPAERSELLRVARRELEQRVGERLINAAPHVDLDEFLRVADRDAAAAAQWLRQHVPDHVRIVENEIAAVRGELSRSAPRILTRLGRRR